MFSNISNEECFSFLLTKMLVMLIVEKIPASLVISHTPKVHTHPESP